MLLASLDAIANVLEWIDQYGADKVLMVFAFFMYMRSQRRVAKLQDARLEDNKEAMEALIEARHALTEMAKNGEELNKELQEHFGSDKEEFGKIRGKLDILLERRDSD